LAVIAGMERMRKTLALAAICAWLTTQLTACTQAPKTVGEKPAGEQKAAGEQKTATGEKKPEGTGEQGKSAEGTGTVDAGKPAGESTTAIADASKSRIPEVQAAQRKVNLQELPDKMVICTVAGSPISVGEYRRMYKLQQIQLQGAIGSNPLSRLRVLEEAKKRGITLTQVEKTKLLAAARNGRAEDSAEFKKYLADKKVTVEQFNKEVLDVGVALKTANVIFQQSLLNDLVNREILLSAARAARLENSAMNRYVAIKHSPTYEQLIKTTGLSADELKDELVKTELVKLMSERIQSRVKVSDAEIAQFYRKNEKNLKHKERVRISQIIVAAPSQDVGPVKSIRAQVEKANPKLAGKELDTAVEMTMDAQRRKAQEILSKAVAGGNFAELSNEWTDDVNAKKAKSGGDMGFQDRSQLVPQLADAIWKLKPGQVYPGLVQTALGFHIVKVTAHEPAGTIPMSEIHQMLKVGLSQEKNTQTLTSWLQQRRRTAQIALSPQFASMLQPSQPAETSSLPNLAQ